MASNQEFEASRGMPAPREVVFEVASDPGLVHRWVPALDEVSATGPDAVHVHGTVGGQELDAEGLYRSRPEQFRVEWGSRGADAYAGWLQVTDGGAGASEVTLHLSFFEADAPAGLQQALETALDELAGEVQTRAGESS
ncbi:SRPBCC family protein [Motilibacter aurantiacus]|uniref:SRPBCC family protein n=1 Tax=Motilibacter aurantiacus TaxID=2714955 RepID=UPI00140A3211|nr:SRPBCC family protein [Motilibacter aurantiacus]NHC45362.1 SRPBCC family protein [Motilibacter aurantiacus]